MSIQYSGNVGQLTSDLGMVLADLDAGQEPQVEPISEGLVVIRPGGEGVIENGSFSVTTADSPNTLEGYRMLVSGRLYDPCAAERDRVRIARMDLQAARREGLSGRAIQAAARDLQESERALRDCVRRSGASSDQVPLVPEPAVVLFRSRDLFRTGDAREDDLRIYVRVLNAADQETLQSFGVNLPEIITYEQITLQARAALPQNGPIRIDRITQDGGAIRVNFTASEALTVHGHIIIDLNPYTGRDLRTFIEMTMAGADLDGVRGEIAERFFVNLNREARSAVASFSRSFNSERASQLSQLFDRDGSLTVLRIVPEPAGIRVTAAVGLLVGARFDPCQALRDVALGTQTELSAALREGVASREINALRAELRQELQAVADCRATN